MPFKYRSKTEIIASILDIASKANSNAEDNKITKTRIMYKVFLSHAQVQEYLPLLIESGLLEYRKHNQTYGITEKGLQFINTYNKIGMNYALSNNVAQTTTTASRSSKDWMSTDDKYYSV
jgi:predicted transcriptional regulator